MVVCKCRKATKLYCFVHKVPVCGECICSSEHQICVTRTYSEWVIDGDYDWPPKCSLCHGSLQAGETATSRLGCLHVFHTSCLVLHLQSFPPHTAPAGYICPTCSVPIWPPKNIKDHSVALPTKLKEVISQSGLSKTLLGNDIVAVQQAAPPLAFSSAPLVTFPTSNLMTRDPAVSETSNGGFSMAEPQHGVSATIGASRENGEGASNSGAETEVDKSSDSSNGLHASSTMVSFPKIANPAALQPGAMTRKNSYRGEKTGLTYAENDGDNDEDGVRRKYSRRGPVHKQFLKYLLPFWSNALPTLPVTAPARKDDHETSVAEELIEGRSRRRPRSSSIDPRKILLVFAIMSCMATMMLLYYRLSQGTASEDLPHVENQ